MFTARAGQASFASLSLDETAVSGTHSLPELRAPRRPLLHWLLTIHPSTSGTLPALLTSSLTLLQKIELEQTRISGTVPHHFKLPRLRQLDLRRTSISGTFPATAAASLFSLQFLDLDRSALSGTLPPELGEAARVGSQFKKKMSSFADVGLRRHSTETE